MGIGENIVSWAQSKIGIPYVYGGDTDSGYDCSGLTYKAYASQGITIPRVAQDQYNNANKVSFDDLHVGDLVFFATGSGQNYVSHVGIYTGNGKFIHSPNSRSKVREDALDGYWKSAFVSGGRYSGTGTNTANSSVTDNEGLASGILSKITTFIVLVLVVALAAIFFFKAFDINII